MHYLIDFLQRHARLVVVAGALLTIIATMFGSGVFSHLQRSDGLESLNSESAAVRQIIDKEFGEPDSIVLFSSNNGWTVDDEAFRQEVESGLAHLRNLGAQTVGYYGTDRADLVSQDKKQTYAIVSFENMPSSEKFEILKRFEQDRTTGTISVTVGGPVVAQHEINEQVANDLLKAELIALPILGILLLLIFRSAVAAALPLLLGLFTIVGGLSMMRLLAGVMDIDRYAVNVIAILGLGLSIDYALLIVSRFREELNNRSVSEAVKQTMKHAGRTILFSGIVIIISLLGLVVFPIGFLRSVGLGGASVVVVAMVGALVILPALLMLTGKYINRWRISKKAVEDHMRAQRDRWRAIGIVVMRRPILSVLCVLVLVGILASPVLHLNLTAADTNYRELPANTSSYAVGKALEQNFATPEPYLEVVYLREEGVQNRAGIGELYDVTEQIESLDDVKRVESLTATDALSREMYTDLYERDVVPPEFRRTVEQMASGEVARLNVYYNESENNTAAYELIRELRNLNVQNGLIMVGGQAAAEYDVFLDIRSYAMFAILLVMAAMFVVLSILLRSIFIPLQAILINSLSLVAVMGVMVWIFQWGNMANITWLTSTGSINVIVPVLVFAVAFGLAMDYTIFLYGRIREAHDKHADNSRAVLTGLELTGPIITQAAVLLAVVVFAFASSNITILQQIGIGLVFVVLFDAFIVRVFLVPAIMQLSGGLNWWVPKWLKRGKAKR